MPVPRCEWERLTLEERVDQLRIENVALWAVVIGAFRAIGVELRDSEGAGDPADGIVRHLRDLLG